MLNQLKYLMFIVLAGTVTSHTYAGQDKFKELAELLSKEGTLHAPSFTKNWSVGTFNYAVEQANLADCPSEFSDFTDQEITKLLKNLPNNGDEWGSLTQMMLEADWQVQLTGGFGHKQVKNDLLDSVSKENRDFVKRLLNDFGSDDDDDGYGISYYHLRLTNEASEPEGADLYVLKKAGNETPDNSVIVVRLYYSYY